MYRKTIGIKKYHHFNFDATSPGKVNVRCAHDGPVTTLNILKVDVELVNDDLPAVVPPKGLSNERQWYLPYSRKLLNGANFRIIRIGKHIFEKFKCLMGVDNHALISSLQNGSFSLLQA